jgi:uncharacterized protein (TIGR02453 family)
LVHPEVVPFDKAALRFLRELEANNDRDWFQPRKQEYETLVRAPMTEIVEAVNRELSKVGPDYITEPSKAIYRIYRDVRFSKNKDPYKTHIGALFPHRLLGKDGGAALYFHLSTKEFLIAGGIYQAPPSALMRVRTHIRDSHDRFANVLREKAVRDYFGALQGDKLTRPPKGFAADDPAIEYLRHKDLLLEVSKPAESGLGSGAVKDLLKGMRLLIPFVSYLNEPFLSRTKRDPLLTVR